MKRKLAWLWLWKSTDRKAYRSTLNYYTHFSGRYINNGQHASDVIYNELQKGKPCLITRFGAVELGTINYFYKNRKEQSLTFSDSKKNQMRQNAGFFSPSDDLLTKFTCDALKILPDVDVFAPWCHRYGMHYEKTIFENYNSYAKLVSIEGLLEYAFFVDRPWMRYLEGKKVLVLHPFEKTIRAQYEKREKLFKNPLALPQFDLKIIKTVQGIGDGSEIHEYKDWFDALESMYRKIDMTDFDVAIVSGGAYGMFLAHYIKSIGKQAVHTAGATQLLFGIKGTRWLKEYSPSYAEKLMNENWVFPFEEETPKSLDKFVNNEGGKAYW